MLGDGSGCEGMLVWVWEQYWVWVGVGSGGGGGSGFEGDCVGRRSCGYEEWVW